MLAAEHQPWMKLIVISSPSPVPAESTCVTRMVHAGLQTFHLRRPEWTDQHFMDFLGPLDDTCRRALVLHACHELVPTMKLKVCRHSYSSIQALLRMKLRASLLAKGRHFTSRLKLQPALARVPGQTYSASFHALQELESDLASQLDYAFLSPVFDSISKSGYGAAFDLATLPDALSNARCPTIALGGAVLSQRVLRPATVSHIISGDANIAGITAENIPVAASLGFAGVAVLGSVWNSEDPVMECTTLLSTCRRI